MSENYREKLQSIKAFPSLIKYLRDELDWPIESVDFEDLTFDYTPEELGIDVNNAAKIQEIKRLRPLTANQPWGIFFVKFEPKRLPVVALRRILSRVALKKRASANSAERIAWSSEDLLFVSNYGEGDSRQISFAHFSQNEDKKDLPTLKVLGWNNLDTPLHLDHIADSLTEHLSWPNDEENVEEWRKHWQAAFTLVHREVITTSKKLSFELAVLARNIRDRIKTVLQIETENGPITKLMGAFKEALIHDLDEENFADMYAQTIAYGLLSARAANPTKGTADDIATAMPITNPFLKELMETFLDVGGRKGKKNKGSGLDFDELGISEVVDLLDAANMEAVVRDFGDKNPQEDPVIHFFEGFLHEYDKKIRKDRGVFYTPRPVVSFIVRSVDELLRTEFGLEDGLADTTTWGEMAGRIDDLEIPEGATATQAFVQILDPATGTGTFLVEVIDLIHNTMTKKWKTEGKLELEIPNLWNDYVPEHLLPRLHGYELMMAPYAIAHMKIGLKLYETGYGFESDERARVYLTNALEPAQDFSGTLAFAIPALAHEAEAVNAIKRDKRFTVVIGNPPYSGESSNKIRWIEDSIRDTYQTINGQRLVEKGKKNWLLDDYVKFIHFSHLLAKRSGVGIVGLITNNAYQDNPTFRGLRHSLFLDFSSLFLVDLHGSGKRPDAGDNETPDENVFDILQGVSVAHLVLNPSRDNHSYVERFDLHGSRDSKYQYLLASLHDTISWSQVKPNPTQWFFVERDLTHEEEWNDYPSLLDIFLVNGNGLISAKDHFAYCHSESELTKNIDTFLDPALSDEEVSQALAIKGNSMWTIQDGRRRLRGERADAEECVVDYRPFDKRHSLYHRDVIFNLRKPVTRNIFGKDNLVILSTRMTKGDEWQHCFITRSISDCAYLSNKTSTNAFVFPLYVYPAGKMFGDMDARQGNIPNEIRDRFGCQNGTEELVHYIYGVLFSSAYRQRFSSFLKYDFPRIPQPETTDVYAQLSSRGRELASVHLMESPKLDRRITSLVGSGDIQVEKVSYSDETVWIDKAKTRGFKGVPEEVWNFHIGGYQVCEKWLKDRQAKGGKNPRPGRVLTDEDIEHYQKIVVALSETIRIMAEIDEVIEENGGWPDAFQTSDSAENDDTLGGASIAADKSINS